MQGQGTIGPRLIDYKTNRNHLYTIIYNGIPGTEMKGWGKKLQPKDIVTIVHHIESLHKNYRIKKNPIKHPFSPPPSNP